MMSKISSSVALSDGILLKGYQRKLKTMKKKYFVLYEETINNCARLEYFDNEKKFKNGSSPKRVIKLKSCFNINRRLDTKHEYVIALSTKDGGFGMVLDTETEMLKWLQVLIKLQRIDDSFSENPRPNFEHVWQVIVQRRGLAEEKGIVGNYHACLTPKSLTFLKIGSEKAAENRIQSIEILLTTIRRCGDSQCFFYMEIGRQSVIGPGELWMETEDSLIAQNMHNMILSAMSSKEDMSMDPMRKRSSSANEATKPISMLIRKQVQCENKPNNPHAGFSYGRERCDSLPSSRNRTSIDGSSQSTIHSSILPPRHSFSLGNRPLSLQQRQINTAICNSESEESSLSIEDLEESGNAISFRYQSRSSDGVILEENNDEFFAGDKKFEDIADMNLGEKKFSVENIFEARNPKRFLSENYKFLEDTTQSYILMEPSYQDVGKTNDIKNTSDDLNSGPDKNNIQFLEYTSDIINTEPINNGDIAYTVDRPTRAYSIGSRLEHNKLKMRLCASTDSDQNTSRVRAFSVGSRAKIPRCDLQRALQTHRSKVDQKDDNTNNNDKNKTATSKCYLSSSHDKKSISAPVLMHRSHNSVNLMDDLMEIDFSKSPSNSYHQSNSSRSGKIYPFSINLKNSDQIDANNLRSQITDNGYLKMKPVNHLSKNNFTNLSNKNIDKNLNKCNDYLSMSPKKSDGYYAQKNYVFKNLETFDNTQVANQCPKDLLNDSKISIISENIESGKVMSNLDIDKSNIRQSEANNDFLNNYIIPTNKEHILNKNVPLERGDVFNNGKNLKFSFKKDTIFSKADRDYTNFILQNDLKDLSLKNSDISKDSINCGYEILQIKSDSSLQTGKILHRISSGGKEEQLSPTVICRPNSANSAPLISSTTCGTSSKKNKNTVSMYRPHSISDSMYCIGNNHVDKTMPNKQLNNVSRPSSICSEHELYYASLDLPQCTEKCFTTNAMKSESSDTCVINAAKITTPSNFTYAKINFDICDSANDVSNLKHLNTS